MSAASKVPDAPATPGSISAFFPAYHDWGTIATQVLLVSRTLRELTDDWEVIVVDDGSRDRTPEVLDELAKVCPQLRVVTHPKNRGYGGALRSGFAAARKEWVFYTDGDAQYDVFELKDLAAKMRPGVDIVNGYKIKRQDSFLRVVIGNAYHVTNSIVLGIKIRDVDCDFRLIRRNVFDKVKLVSRGGEICVELVKKCQEAGMKFEEVPVHHYYRRSGASQFFVWRRIVAAVRGIWRLWKQFLFNNKKEE